MPAVSVIIPTYNRAELVQLAIQSVLTQTFNDFELIVVDDGSTDNTSGVLRKYESNIMVKLLRQPNKGCPAALNHGLRESNGKYICWLSSDDIWMKDKLEKQVAYFAQHKEVKLVFTDYEIADEQGQSLRIKRFNKASMPLEMMVEYIHGSSVMFLRDCLNTIGFFDESLLCHNDVDYWLKIGKKHKIGHIPEALVRTSHADGRDSDNRKRMIESRVLFLIKNGLPLELFGWGDSDRYFREYKYKYAMKLLGKIGFYKYWFSKFIFNRGWLYLSIDYLGKMDRLFEQFKKKWYKSK